MKVLLTSFGVTQGTTYDDKWHQSTFFRMPPMQTGNNSRMPDFNTLLLAEKLLLDEDSYLALQSVSAEKPLFKPYLETVEALLDNGRLELVNFGRILAEQKNEIDDLTHQDMKDWSRWIDPFKKSLLTWDRIAHNLDPTDRTPPLEEAQITKVITAEGPNKIESYLRYVNANLILCKALDAACHDWTDFLPFYERKFAGEKRLDMTPQTEALCKLFTVTFPRLSISDTSAFMHIMEDRRIVELRLLVKKAVEEGAEFDEEFGIRAMSEAFAAEGIASKQKEAISLATWFVSFFVPLPITGSLVTKALVKGSGELVDHYFRKGRQWVFLLRDAYIRQTRMPEQ